MYDYIFARVVYHILNNFPKKRKVKKFQLNQIDEKSSKFRIGQLNNCKSICGTIQELNRDVFLPARVRSERGLEIAESNSGQFPRKG